MTRWTRRIAAVEQIRFDTCTTTKRNSNFNYALVYAAIAVNQAASMQALPYRSLHFVEIVGELLKAKLRPESRARLYLLPSYRKQTLLNGALLAGEFENVGNENKTYGICNVDDNRSRIGTAFETFAFFSSSQVCHFSFGFPPRYCGNDTSSAEVGNDQECPLYFRLLGERYSHYRDYLSGHTLNDAETEDLHRIEDARDVELFRGSRQREPDRFLRHLDDDGWYRPLLASSLPGTLMRQVRYSSSGTPFLRRRHGRLARYPAVRNVEGLS